MINSLSNNKEYCYASDSYFANILGVKEKTISNSVNKLKREKYIVVNVVNGKRRIYLNKEIVSDENSKVLEKNCQYKRKEYTRKNNKINATQVPYWLDEYEYMEKLLSKYKEN